MAMNFSPSKKYLVYGVEVEETTELDANRKAVKVLTVTKWGRQQFDPTQFASKLNKGFGQKISWKSEAHPKEETPFGDIEGHTVFSFIIPTNRK